MSSYSHNLMHLELSSKFLLFPISKGFCSQKKFTSISILFTRSSNLFDTVPNAPVTTGIICTSRQCYIRLISLRRPWYFLIFSLSFSIYLVSDGHATSINKQDFFSFPISTISGFENSISLSIWSLMSHITFTLTFLRILFALWSYDF